MRHTIAIAAIASAAPNQMAASSTSTSYITIACRSLPRTYSQLCALVAGDRVTLTPSPARDVPGFAMHYVPAFDLASVPAEITTAATRVAAKRSTHGNDV